MKWLIQTFGSSIGKKLLMAVTGFGFMMFLSVHLAGNLTIYGGAETFNAYAQRLHSLGVLLTAFNLGLIGFAVIHVLTGLILFIQNFKSRPDRYSMDKPAGGRTWSSVAMPYTGLVTLVFVIFHLLNFTFVDKTNTKIFEIVSSAFANPVYVVLYIIAVIVVALHVRHGLWSAFQTLGANHPKYMPAIMGLSLIFGLLIGFGFGILPVYVWSLG